MGIGGFENPVEPPEEITVSTRRLRHTHRVQDRFVILVH